MLGRQAHFPLLPTYNHYIPLVSLSQYTTTTYPQIKKHPEIPSVLPFGIGPRRWGARGPLVDAGLIMFVATTTRQSDEHDGNNQPNHCSSRKLNKPYHVLHVPSWKRLAWVYYKTNKKSRLRLNLDCFLSGNVLL